MEAKEDRSLSRENKREVVRSAEDLWVSPVCSHRYLELMKDLEAELKFYREKRRQAST